jgi:phage FluMu protein Com
MFSASALVDRIRGEYAIMPGLKLTKEQACRLWGVDGDTCNAALQALVAEGFLHCTGTEKYVALPRPAGRAMQVSANDSNLASVRCPHCRKLNTLEREESGQHYLGTFRCVACHRVLSFTAISA